MAQGNSAHDGEVSRLTFVASCRRHEVVRYSRFMDFNLTCVSASDWAQVAMCTGMVERLGLHREFEPQAVLEGSMEYSMEKEGRLGQDGEFGRQA